ncbi:MAG: hypothetical protein MUC28_00590 [Planctomycetes bacterium]|jgi:hypothetical protein|nr:hypothetical protein [Planctomycetota bacterium]
MGKEAPAVKINYEAAGIKEQVPEPEDYYEKLNALTSDFSSVIRTELKKYAADGEPDLIDNKGRIRMSPFKSNFGDERIEWDMITVKQKGFGPDFTNPKVQDHFGPIYGTKDPVKMAERHSEESEERHGSLGEMAITCILHKILRDRFLVMRTAIFDDYENGADNLIVDKKTGEAVCAVDEVVDEPGGKWETAKSRKVREKNRRGGNKIRYGITIRNGKLEKGQLRDIPCFYLCLSKVELTELLQGMVYDRNEVSPAELKAFDRIFPAPDGQDQISENHSWLGQARALEKSDFPAPLLANVKKFFNTLEDMRKLRSEKYGGSKSG